MIEFQNLNFRIDGKLILKDINLSIKEGEFAAVIGPNGAGKSTLIKVLLGLASPYEGKIKIDDIDHRIWLRNNTIGYLPQKEVFDRAFPATAMDIVLMGLAAEVSIGRSFSALHKQRAALALSECGMEHMLKAQIGTLSGGEFQRVLLARALVTGAKYLILDEPEASIDRAGVESFFGLLRKVHEAGKTIITISHDLHTLNKYCTFLICLNQSLHCHDHLELVNSETVQKTFGETLRIIEKDY